MIQQLLKMNYPYSIFKWQQNFSCVSFSFSVFIIFVVLLVLKMTSVILLFLYIGVILMHWKMLFVSVQ